jgi:PHD/YefM family antitoxin component YafN of YafNO toxin-antitoxin module
MGARTRQRAFSTRVRNTDDEFRERANDMIHLLLARGASFLAERHGDLTVVSSREYESLQATVEILQDDEAMRDIRASERQPDEEAVDYDVLRRRRGLAKA